MSKAFGIGVIDGWEQGFTLSSGMTYESRARQFAYDMGTWVGGIANLARR